MSDTPKTDALAAIVYEHYFGKSPDEVDKSAPYVDIWNHARQLERDNTSLREQLRVAQERWISVKERLPDIGDIVIAYTPRSLSRKVKPLMRLIRHEGATEFYWDLPSGGSVCVPEAVTHWMPLPTPPAESTEGKT